MKDRLGRNTASTGLVLNYVEDRLCPPTLPKRDRVFTLKFSPPWSREVPMIMKWHTAGKAMMTDDLRLNRALLPAGFGDLLPPDAAIEAQLIEAMMHVFNLHGYERVKPPLLEFEASLLSGAGAAVAEQTFRLMDPESQRMMALRADTTPQIARIATTRLADAPRPLRLAYAGQCLLARGGQVAPERQITQAGIELIGVDAAEADAETIMVAAEALESAGVSKISVDLTMPPLVPALLTDANFDPLTRTELSHALDRKDAASVQELAGNSANLLCAMLEAAGPAAAALEALERVALPSLVQPMVQRLKTIVARLNAVLPTLRLTVDPVEFRGYLYHTGVAVTIFAPGRQAELGRGGRYRCDGSEDATGITLYPDRIRAAAPRQLAHRRLYLPPGTPAPAAKTARQQGFATVVGFSDPTNACAEAMRLGCTHVWRNGAAIAIEEC